MSRRAEARTTITLAAAETIFSRWEVLEVGGKRLVVVDVRGSLLTCRPFRWYHHLTLPLRRRPALLAIVQTLLFVLAWALVTILWRYR